MNSQWFNNSRAKACVTCNVCGSAYAYASDCSCKQIFTTPFPKVDSFELFRKEMEEKPLRNKETEKKETKH